MISWDIETGPLPDDIIGRAFQPPKPKPRPAKFNEADVKTGNLKDPVKIKAKIEDARRKHAAEIREWKQKEESAREEAYSDFRSKAGLDPGTGRVLAIGWYSTTKDSFVFDGMEDENQLLAEFWFKVDTFRTRGEKLVGLNIFEFDLPFICCRCSILGVDVPQWAFNRRGRWLDWNDVFVDLRFLWLFGRHPGSCKSNFDLLSAAYGTPGKPDDVDGGDFAELWKTDRDKAIAYLESDVRQPAYWAKRLGIH